MAKKTTQRLSKKELKENREKKGKIHLLKLEISNLDAETKSLFKKTANEMKRISNCVRRVWLCEHTKAGNVERIHDYLHRLENWYKLPLIECKPKKKGDKKTFKRNEPVPKCEVYCFTSEIKSAIYQAIKDNYPLVNARCGELSVNILQSSMSERKSSKGNLKQWMRILADDGEYPNSSKPAPIPFDARNSEILPPLNDKDDFQLRLRIDRIERPGKMATSTNQVVKLFTKKRQMAGQTKELWKIASGEYTFCGSNLVFMETKGKWFAHICFRKPIKKNEHLDKNKVAFLYPSRRHPWTLRINGESRWVSGKGYYVGEKREQLLTYRWSHQGAYRYATSARKGHGRQRAIGRMSILRDAWTNFVDTVNHQTTHDVVERCIQNGVGKLIYFQPTGKFAESRFLHNAGKKSGRIDNTGWDWYKIYTQLKYKCERAGIELVPPKKIGEIDPFEKKSPKSKSSK